VYKAVHKESGQQLAIKQVPVDSDLQDIIKEISIMQQCDRYDELPVLVHIKLLLVLINKHLNWVSKKLSHLLA